MWANSQLCLLFWLNKNDYFPRSRYLQSLIFFLTFKYWLFFFILLFCSLQPIYIYIKILIVRLCNRLYLSCTWFIGYIVRYILKFIFLSFCSNGLPDAKHFNLEIFPLRFWPSIYMQLFVSLLHLVPWVYLQANFFDANSSKNEQVR